MRKTSLGKMLVSAALAAVMCLSMTTAFAEEQGAIIADDAAITKKLDVPMGTECPTAMFEFKIEKLSYNGEKTAEEVAKVPTIENKKISFSMADTANPDNTKKINFYAKNVNIFEGIEFNAVGQYTYTITEVKDTYKLGTNETMGYSEAEYELSAYVQKNATSGKFEITNVGAKIIKIDHPGQEGGKKVKPTPGTVDIKSINELMTFTNSFYKKTNPGPIDPEKPETTALQLTKTVTGAYGDLTKDFKFNLNITKPGLVALKDIETFNAERYGADNKKIGETLTLKYNQDNEVSLKHGEKLLVGETFVGSVFSVEEQAAAAYTPSYKLTLNDAVDTDATTGSKGASLKTRTDTQISEKKDIAAFTNDITEITPTGIIMNSLPYFMMVLVAVGAFAAYVVDKSRRRNRG